MTEDNDNAVLAIRDVWYAQAADKAMTLETLPAFLKELAEYKHDYNTICYALTAGAIATAWALNRTPNGGITGFQAGAIMWEFMEAFSGAHFATFPEELVARCILAGSRPGDVVFDPFMGSGTVAKVATDLGRNFIGCELNPNYVELHDLRRTTIGMPI